MEMQPLKNSQQGSIYEADLGGTKVIIQAASSESTTGNYLTQDGKMVRQTVRREVLTPTITTTAASVRELGTVQGSPEFSQRLISCSGVYSQLQDNKNNAGRRIEGVYGAPSINTVASSNFSPTSFKGFYPPTTQVSDPVVFQNASRCNDARMSLLASSDTLSCASSAINSSGSITHTIAESPRRRYFLTQDNLPSASCTTKWIPPAIHTNVGAAAVPIESHFKRMKTPIVQTSPFSPHNNNPNTQNLRFSVANTVIDELQQRGNQTNQLR